MYDVNQAVTFIYGVGFVDEQTGEIVEPPADIKEKLNVRGKEIKLDDYILSLIHSIKNREATLDAIKKEQTRLKELKERTEKSIENAGKWLGFVLGEGTKWSLGVHKISWRSGTSVEIEDEKLVPPQFTKERVVVTPDREEIKRHLSMGAKIPGCSLNTKSHIQVT